MKILVFLNRFIIGGAEVNSIDLNSMLHDVYGHDIVLFGAPGPMVKVAEEKGLRVIPAPRGLTHPSIPRIRVLRDVIRRERPDLVQAWDWRAGLDAFFAAHLTMGVPIHIAHSDMDIDRLLPKKVPTTFMTPELVDRARRSGRGPVELILPPVDVNLNAPAAVDPHPFRAQFGIGTNDIAIITVSRLATSMKSESLRRTIAAIRTLGSAFPLKLIIVGDGDARPGLERLAADVNNELRRQAVLLTGELVDPRPAYAAADIVIGMGGSSLRGMAFQKPVIIVGKDGFSEPFTPETADMFYYKGMYGLGDGVDGDERLVRNVRSFVERPEKLRDIGQFSRDFVVRHFSLEQVSARLEQFSQTAVKQKPRFHHTPADALRTVAVLLSRKVMPDFIRQWLRPSTITDKPNHARHASPSLPLNTSTATTPFTT